MFAAYADRVDPHDPLSCLQLGDRPEPAPPPGAEADWTTVTVKAASLNHHDLWSLRGVGLSAAALPMILGCDAAGVDEDGNEVVVHGVVSDPRWRGDETEDPRRSLLSERYQGTFAERVTVPRANLVPKPASLSYAEAACLPTAYLTAYRMLFTKADVGPGATVLVQGAGGGVATALVTLGAAAGLRMWVTTRDARKAGRALALGADRTFESGERLPSRVDAVMETVGAATWDHSLRSVRPGGTVVVSGATSGYEATTALNRIFFLQLRVIGSTMGTRAELTRLLALCDAAGVRPTIDHQMPLRRARDGFAALAAGSLFGKLVFTL